MFGITLLIPSIKYFIYLDEICAYSLLCVALADCIFNNNWKKYSLLWILMLIMSFYAWYSIRFMDNNTVGMILKDWIIELKPYIPFSILFSIGSQFSESDKKYIKYACIFNATVMLIILSGGYRITALLVSHPSYAGHITFLSSVLFYYCSRDRISGSVSKQNCWIALAILSIGILGFKAKYFALFVPAIYLLIFYKPGTFSKFSIKHALIAVAIFFSCIAVTWNKIQYYFLQGNSESFDPTVVQSYARPVLYMTAGMILKDHFPFGTGLASFASFPSAENYSNVYFEYGIHTVHGISFKSETSFICDAFYPSLAQFGVIGLILFIWFWFYIYGYLRLMIRTDSTLYRAPFVTGSLIIIFILVESTAATTFTQTAGMLSMSLLGIVCSYGRQIKYNILKNENQKQFAIQKI